MKRSEEIVVDIEMSTADGRTDWRCIHISAGNVALFLDRVQSIYLSKGGTHQNLIFWTSTKGFW